jgi:hypothetical protein
LNGRTSRTDFSIRAAFSLSLPRKRSQAIPALVAETMSGALMGMRRGMNRFGLALVGTVGR